MKIIEIFRNIFLGLVVVILGVLAVFTFAMVPLPFIDTGYILGNTEKAAPILSYWAFVFFEGFFRAGCLLVVIAVVWGFHVVGRKITDIFG